MIYSQLAILESKIKHDFNEILFGSKIIVESPY